MLYTVRRTNLEQKDLGNATPRVLSQELSLARNAGVLPGMMRRLFADRRCQKGMCRLAWFHILLASRAPPAASRRGVMGDVARSVWTTECIYMRTV